MESTKQNRLLSAIVGNDAIRQRLAHSLRSGTLPHACILEGPSGSGKHTIAKHMAAALACTADKSQASTIPCLRCPQCRKVLDGKFPDLILIGREEDKATIGVDTIRFLREDVHVIPNDSDHKIYIIEEADRMTEQAQNAFLLTLEEPPSYAHFFLLCENAGMLLETIRSRAPIFRTQPLTREQIAEYLCEHDDRADQMRRTDPRGFNELIAASGHGIGQALSYLEPKHYTPIKQLRDAVSELLRGGIEHADAQVLLPLLLRYGNGKREALQDFLLLLLDAVRDLLLLKKSENAPLSFYANREEAIALCDNASLQSLYRLHEAIQAALDENQRNVNVRLILTKLALDAEWI
ncbi:MAG: hypothetical protein IKA76_03655 [Clostridia bacterium]|nr:hypothetical protein [Clostridia bacterium]